MPERENTVYRGRFAPSPSGPLHFGSLVAALGSYLDARAHGGEWLVRMEDLDPPRVKPGAAEDILATLEAYGFEWNGPVLYQSEREAAYQAAFSELQKLGKVYGCACSRREINDLGQTGLDGPRYPGTCRNGPSGGRQARAYRVRTDDSVIGFTDRLAGYQEQRLYQDIGDFVLRRADGLYAYQLAVVVDDAYQGINQVVRGSDLLVSTPRQIFLQRLLGMEQPDYAHLPLVMDSEGKKLSKQDGAHPINKSRPLPALMEALRFLLPDEAETPDQYQDLEAFWSRATLAWKKHIL